MPGLDIRLNSKSYVLSPREDGTKLVTRPVRQFVQPIRQTGRTRPEDVAPYETFIHPNMTYGFGRYRINSDAAFEPSEYRRCWDSTCETRWMDAVYLPILGEDATQTNCNVVRASVDFKGETHALWEQTASGQIVSRQFTGASTDTWENGGTVNPIFVSETTLAHPSQSTVNNTSYTFPAGNNKCLVVLLTADEGASGGVQDPSTITYDGVGLTKLVGAPLSGGPPTYSDNYCAIYYLANPASGSNTFALRWIDDGSANISGGARATLIAFHGVDQDTPMSSGANSSTSGSSSSVAVTTVVGDGVVSAITTTDGTITTGAGQTEFDNTGLGSHAEGACSYEVATSTTTTMSYSFGASETFNHSTGIVNPSSACVALDLIQHKTNLVALIADADGHSTYTSTDGVTWAISTTPITAGLLANSVTANENIDAGLLASIGGELVALIWDEDSGTITAFSSTNAGVAWSDESGFDIASANGPQGVAVYQDIDGENKLYVATTEGIYIVDTSPSTWTYELVVPMPAHADNGRRMTVHQGAIWFAQGVDNDSPAPISRLTVSGNARVVETGYGLSAGDAVPSELLGPVNWMQSTGDFLFIAVGGGAGSRHGRILCWNGLGWHHMTENTTANQKMHWLHVGSGDDGIPRLHYAMRTATNASDVKFLEQPLVNPRSGVSIKREDDSDGVVGYIDLPYVDMGMPHEKKAFLRAHINADDLNSSAADEYIKIQYGTDNAARTTTALGNFTSATTANTFGSNAGVSGQNLGMRISLLRGSTNTDTPKLKDVTVEAAVIPGNGNISYQHEMIIDIQKSADATGQSFETVISNLKTLLATTTQVDLEFGKESRKVVPDRENSAFLTRFHTNESSGAPNSLATRTGYMRVVLSELIPLS